jgi:hypothetical protein
MPNPHAVFCPAQAERTIYIDCEGLKTPKVSKQNFLRIPKISIYEGAGSRIRTDDLLITNCYGDALQSASASMSRYQQIQHIA